MRVLVEVMTAEETLIQIIEIKEIQWFGHLLWMDETH